MNVERESSESVLSACLDDNDDDDIVLSIPFLDLCHIYLQYHFFFLIFGTFYVLSSHPTCRADIRPNVVIHDDCVNMKLFATCGFDFCVTLQHAQTLPFMYTQFLSLSLFQDVSDIDIDYKMERNLRNILVHTLFSNIF